MKVVVTDFTFPTLEVEEAILRPEGHEVVGGQSKTAAALIPLVSDADVVIAQFAPISAEVIAAMDRARAIVRYGIGVDNVDLEAAKAQGIPVCNVPAYCVDEVADHTLAFLLATTRQVVPNTVRNRDGKWGIATPLDRMHALRDMTVGVVGFGRIGREVVARLRAFKCRVLVHDPAVSDADIERAGVSPASLPTLFRSSDAVTLHCPSTPATRGLIDRESIALMKPGAILINVARGDLVNSDALTDALRDGQLSAAALDVFAPEPIPPDHPILQMENVIIASHIASASVPAVRKLRETVAQTALAAIRGEPLSSVVNGVDRSRFS